MSYVIGTHPRCVICNGRPISQRQANIIQFLLAEIVNTTRTFSEKRKVTSYHNQVFQAASDIFDEMLASAVFMPQETNVFPCSFCSFPFLESDHIAKSTCERLMHEVAVFSDDMLFEMKVRAMRILRKLKNYNVQNLV